MITKSSRLVVFFVLLSIVLSGCTSELMTKTVIIPDPKESINPDKTNGVFEVKSIYKLFEKEDVNGEILGWADKSQVLGLFGRELTLSFERMDYKFNSRQIVAKAQNGLEVAQVSPDGLHVVYLAEADAGKNLILLNLASHKETLIQANLEAVYEYVPLVWSNNSQYISFGVDGVLQRAGKDSKLMVYDVVHNTMRTLLIPLSNIEEMNKGIKISDDGKSALITKIVEGKYILVYGKIVGDAFNGQYEQPISSSGTFSFLNNDQIIFVSFGGSLNLFDSRNATTTVLMESVRIFQLSKDGKYIVYSKDQEEIYVAKLQGNNVINEKSIYKGLIPNQMQWSPDNNKVLLSGRRLYGVEELIPGPIVVADSRQLKADYLPLIIEFK